MENLIELSVSGEMFFFVNEFSDQELDLLESTTKRYYPNAYIINGSFDVAVYIRKMRNATGLCLKQVKITKVIAV